MAYQTHRSSGGQLSSKIGKYCFCQMPRHTHDDPRTKEPGLAASRRATEEMRQIDIAIVLHERVPMGLGKVAELLFFLPGAL